MRLIANTKFSAFACEEFEVAKSRDVKTNTLKNNSPWKVREAHFLGDPDCRDREPTAPRIASYGPCWLRRRRRQRRQSCRSPQRGRLSSSAAEEDLPFPQILSQITRNRHYDLRFEFEGR